MTAELLDVYMGKLEQQLDRSEDTFRNVSTFLLLLQHFPGDMEPVFQRDVVVFFTVQIPKLDTLRCVLLACICCNFTLVSAGALDDVCLISHILSASLLSKETEFSQHVYTVPDQLCCREDSRITLAFISALNAFMLQHGLDVRSMSLGLQQALNPFITRCWGMARDAKLKDAILLLLHIQFKLGAVQVMTLLCALCTMDLNAQCELLCSSNVISVLMSCTLQCGKCPQIHALLAMCLSTAALPLRSWN